MAGVSRSGVPAGNQEVALCRKCDLPPCYFVENGFKAKEEEYKDGQATKVKRGVKATEDEKGPLILEATETFCLSAGSSDNRRWEREPMEHIQRLQKKLERLQRRQRRALAVSMAVLVLALLSAAITVTGDDLEIHPNEVGGNPNDSYELKLTGDGSSGADRAMSLKTVPTTDSNYRLAISDNGGTERFTIENGGDFGVGNTSPSSVLHVDSNTGNTTSILTFESTANNFDWFVTTADPESAITANVGDLAVDTTNGNFWLKHTGAGNTGWDRIGPRNAFMAYDATGNQTINDMLVTLNIDTVQFADPTYSLASSEITFNKDGIYLVTVELNFQVTNDSGGPAALVRMFVQEDTGGGWSTITYAKSNAEAFEVTGGGGHFGTTQTWLRSFNNTDKLRVRMVRVNGDTNLDTLADGSRITIERVN